MPRKLRSWQGFRSRRRPPSWWPRSGRQAPKHPYSWEKLCPVLALYVEESEDDVMRKAVAVLQHEGAGHSFMIHARDEAVIRRFALEIPVSRFLVNTPGALGGIGATTNLFPALTLGCGAVGGSSSPTTSVPWTSSTSAGWPGASGMWKAPGRATAPSVKP